MGLSSKSKNNESSNLFNIKRIDSRFFTTLTYIGLFLVYNYISSGGAVDAFLFPPLAKVWGAFLENSDTMFKNMIASFSLMIPSVVIAVIIALAVGIILGLNKRLREIFLPMIYTCSVVPSILLSPFALLLAPSFKAASLFMITYSILWPTIFGTINGITTIDKRYLDTADTLELKGIKKMIKVVLPAALPSIMSGFNTSLRGSFTMLVFAEMYGASYGMGYFVKKNADYGLYANVWSGFIFMVVVLVLVVTIFEKIKDRMLRWSME